MKGSDRFKKGVCETAHPFFCAHPIRVHSLGGASPLGTLMTGTVSRTAKAVTAKGCLEDAVSGAPGPGKTKRI